MLTRSITKTAVVDAVQKIDVNVKKRDGFKPDAITPLNDGSGGSLGVFGLLSLLGLGLFRRKH